VIGHAVSLWQKISFFRDVVLCCCLCAGCIVPFNVRNYTPRHNVTFLKNCIFCNCIVRTSNFYIFLMLEIIRSFSMPLACETLMLIQHFLQVLEADMSQWDQKISDLVELGKELAQEGHFDADNILSASRSCQEK